MLRTIWLTVGNEARLLLRDPIVLFMLLFAPVIIICVAGYSLGSLYGGVASTLVVPVADLDQGAVSQGIIGALRAQPSLRVEVVGDVDQVRRMVGYRDRTPLGIEIPAGASASITQGRRPHLVLFVDPVRRIEVNALELRIDELCREVTERELAEAQAQIDRAGDRLRGEIARLSTEIEQEQSEGRRRLEQTRGELEFAIHQQVADAMKQAGDQLEVAVRKRQESAWSDVQRQLERRASILIDIQNYLKQLQLSQRGLEEWIAGLKKMAGSHAADIPPPPSFPTPPSADELAQLGAPISPPKLDAFQPAEAPPPEPLAKLPALPTLDAKDLSRELKQFASPTTVTLPAGLAFDERPAIDGETPVVNAFDQYVPGFGITFLLIGMMLGIALTLFDEREWGTLKRLQVSGAPLSGLLMGKLTARFLVGLVQMAILFAVGWVLFGISLGHHPLALAIPIVAISYASGALGLVIASIARAHDSVMPLGTVVSMAMAAIGGCWWPLDFEPAWMRVLARWMPTTWTMEAFNNLMIRNLPASSTLWPFAATVGLGTIFLAVGLTRLVRLEE
jgi:ABC-type multidrug transport system permease subunit